ncbi:hypothetical protein AAHB54_09835, partial [Bacillus cereus]
GTSFHVSDGWCSLLWEQTKLRVFAFIVKRFRVFVRRFNVFSILCARHVIPPFAIYELPSQHTVQ